MNILHYTNRFQLILDVIFRPNKVIEEIEYRKQEDIDNLTKDFTERLERIGYDQYKTGITHPSITNNTIAIMKTAIVKESGQVAAEVVHKSLQPIHIKLPYFSDEISNDEQKKIGAKQIAMILIEKGFLQTHIDLRKNEVVIYINAFGIKK